MTTAPSPAPDVRSGCQALTKSGQRCTATPTKGGHYCWWHDPENQEEAHAARLQGARTGRALGLHSAPDLDLRSPQKVLEASSLVATAVLRGQVDPKVGNCLAVLFGAALRAADQDLEERIREIEEIMDGLQRRSEWRK